ncbi:PREDICTED: pleckstrin homology domain-containing family A member 5-like [Thamnophis sirtalis]|uniref:Pleckstrin homology domain-containing family A member 5-like n=1 Tax=Thamnophis sirtalis TaxID=35019 RepID=A0A6I9YV85_9SAUR|nr:PREDICTED: pleckstrin homology domain-containing family A member 5-like [Thamnophis sirtalis]
MTQGVDITLDEVKFNYVIPPRSAKNRLDLTLRLLKWNIQKYKYRCLTLTEVNICLFGYEYLLTMRIRKLYAWWHVLDFSTHATYMEILGHIHTAQQRDLKVESVLHPDSDCLHTLHLPYSPIQPELETYSSKLLIYQPSQVERTDLPTGWEEAYTFEGARYYINHNERKVTCKHPVTGQPSQDNCIFVVNEQTAAAMTSEEKKERPLNMVSEAAHYNLTSDYTAHPMSPLGRTSRSSKKVHNFGKRSNSIKRNPNAPVVRRGWLYKQDSTGMKLWKKRWFVLSDLCLFYYRDEKEEGILGSILLPSFQIAMLSSEDHINRKYAFKVRIFRNFALAVFYVSVEYNCEHMNF